MAIICSFLFLHFLTSYLRLPTSTLPLPWHAFFNSYAAPTKNSFMKTGNAKAAPRKVLIIEDEGDLCLLLNLLLDGEGMEVDHVQSLAKAEEYLLQEKPSLVLLDNRLPDGFGIDFIGFIKKEAPDTKVIMISGVDAAAQDVALENGADKFIKKPFTKAQLHESVVQLLN
jgi:two-component system, OmpR family, response regulator